MAGERSGRQSGQSDQHAPRQQAARQGSMEAKTSKRESGGTSGSSSGRPKPPGKIAGGKFEVDKKLGAGCFGEVFRAHNVESKEIVAVKFEALEARTHQLEQEAAIMSLLKQGVPDKTPLQGFAECFWFGREGRYQCMVMEYLGRSLEDRLQMCGGKFKPLTSALIAEQLIRRTEYLHSKCIIHRDIKPENFMWGTKSRLHHVFMIDFGLSKRYYDGSHIQMREKLSLTGTARYASINAHKGNEQSRRDDLEAIGHMLLYFLRGVLPWSGLEARTKEEKYRKIREKKERADLNELCQGYPKEFQTYLTYARNLEFTERPDYKWMRKLFQDYIDSSSHQNEWDLEWITDNPEVNVKELTSINPWTPPRQPDDVDPGASRSRFPFCFCGGKQVRKMA